VSAKVDGVVGYTRNTPTANWQGELEHFQASQRWTFSTWDQLLALLQQTTEEADPSMQVPSQ
jgi:hypothetical protein